MDSDGSAYSSPMVQQLQTPILADSPSNFSTTPDDDSQSLTSNAYNLIDENGRTYHGYRAGSYLFPNDSAETERLNYQYNLLKYAFSNRNYLAPLSQPQRILDIGTGTGQWAIEMGDEFPEASVQGTDLSPIQPSDVPSNVVFYVDDANEDDWAVPPASFDYIHTRVLLGCFPSFRDIIRKGFYYTKPGGYMESQEFLPTPFCDDNTMPKDWTLLEWIKYSDRASVDAERPLRIAHKLKRWYEEAGFVDVREEVFKIPMSSWPRDRHMKHLGRMAQENWLAGLSGFSMAPFTRMLNWSKDELEVYLVDVRKAIMDKSVHAYNKVYVVYGRKPFEGKGKGKSKSSDKNRRRK